MKIIDYTCKNCGIENERIIFNDSVCPQGLCCVCCKRQQLQPLECEMAQLEFARSAEGKKLSENDVKGFLMEKAVSDALFSLKIPHDHNPFDNTYPCYQNKRPDIVIEKLKMVIECKNLSKKQVDHSLSQDWLDKNIVKRPYFAKYRRKIVLLSFKPLKPSLAYLHKHGWKVYSLGTQILTPEHQKKAIGRMKQRFYWLKKEHYKDTPLAQKSQLQLKVGSLRKTAETQPSEIKQHPSKVNGRKGEHAAFWGLLLT